MLWWILGVLAALLLLLCLTRVGMQVVLKNGSAMVDVKVSLFRIRVYPGKEKNEPKQGKKPGKGGGEKKALPKFALEDIKDAVKTLWPPLRRALDRTRRGLRIAPLDLSLTLGGLEDPAKTAELYGWLHAGMWNAMPALEKLIHIPDPHLHIGVDFNTEKTSVEGEIGVTARIGTLLLTGLGAGIPALRWFLRYQKKMKQQKPAPQPAA